MARKVLISFLGVGPKINIGKVKEERTYRPATYHFCDETDTQSSTYNEEKNDFSTSFVADALVQKYGIDDTILLGTTHSMWERVYEVFCNNKNIDIDENYYLELADYCDKATSKKELKIPHPEKIEKVLGKDSHIVLLKYGINKKEIDENISIILQLQEFLKNNDELIVDITHSFRSLPLYIMNLLLYLKNVSTKKIKISRICYGMLDATDEFGYTPVVSLNGIIDVNDWIIGAYNFQQFGNTYKLSKLLEKDDTGDYGSISNALRKFADVKNLNYLREFRTRIGDLRTLCNKDKLPELGKELIAPVMEKFIKRFPDDLNQSVFQFRMAEWHYNHYNYGFALTVLIEAIVTYCCEVVYTNNENKDEIINDKKHRDHIKDVLNDKESDDMILFAKIEENLKAYIDCYDEDSTYDVFKSNWSTTNRDRNMIVHNRMGGRDYSEIIKDLYKNIKYFSKYLGK